MEETSEEERHIEGYTIVLPSTMLQMRYARIVLLIKEDINFKLLNQHIQQTTASIWISVGSRGKKPLVIGGMYREQSLLRQGRDNMTDAPDRQLARWNVQLEGWKAAVAGNQDCVAVGDINLDFINWNARDYHNFSMVARTQSEIETSGFHQLVREVTRSWPGQADSIVDHIWSNCLNRIVSHSNTVRASADHNLLTV